MTPWIPRVHGFTTRFKNNKQCRTAATLYWENHGGFRSVRTEGLGHPTVDRLLSS